MAKVLDLPVELLGFILSREERRPRQPFDEGDLYSPSFAERQYAFLGLERLAPLRAGVGGPAWKEAFLRRPRYSLTVDVDRALELALVCKAFFRALRRLPDVRREVTRLDCVIGLLGSTHDCDRYPYFPARFCSEDNQYLKEVVDTLSFSLPCERSFVLDGNKCYTVTLMHDAVRDDDVYIALCDGFLFFYDHTEHSLSELERVYMRRVMRVKGWTAMRNSVLVSSHCGNANEHRSVALADADAFAQRFGMPHFRVQVSQRLSHPLTPEQQNVKEAVYAVARMLRPPEIVIAPPEKAPRGGRSKCVLM